MKHLILSLIFVLGFFQCHLKAQNNHEHDEVMHFTSVEYLPEYPDGWDGLFNFIKSEIEIPPESNQTEIEARVFVSFVIDKLGKPNAFKIEQSATQIIDDAVLKAFKKMKDWKPAQDHGHVVDVRLILPYKVNLQ